jgi:NAD(P)-dependent dehydrogenase (short-subunit alcohol dehydrogenase family)
MDLELSGDVAVVTGGGRGIGRVIALRLALEGADVAVVSRNHAELERVADQIRQETGCRSCAAVADTTDVGAVRAMAEHVAEELGPIRVLINCAARSASQLRPAAWNTVDEDALMPEIDTKVLGYLRCAQAVVPYMRELGGGRIVNVAGGTAGRTGNLIATIRNSSVIALTKQLADDLGPYGIGVNAISPDATRTERTSAMIERRAVERQVSAKEIELEMAGRNVIGRLVESTEVADVVAFLASSRSVAITGENISVGGGRPGVIRY